MYPYLTIPEELNSYAKQGFTVLNIKLQKGKLSPQGTDYHQYYTGRFYLMWWINPAFDKSGQQLPKLCKFMIYS
jgi:hypothetical protein